MAGCFASVWPANSQTRKATKQRWRLVWADEFNYNGLPDPKKWSYDVGGHGWGNKELQYYTDQRKENARVEDGHLIIEARREQVLAEGLDAGHVTQIESENFQPLRPLGKIRLHGVPRRGVPWKTGGDDQMGA